MREWFGGPADPMFPSERGGPLSRDGAEGVLAKHVANARRQCPTLAKKRISMHVLRHSVAMDLLQQGVDRSVIALWLGHESIETTEVYYVQKVDMCSGCAKLPIVNGRAWLDSA